MNPPVLTIVSAAGPRNSTCGYCSPPGQRSEKASFAQRCGISAHQMSVTVYKSLIDRGFRRSGTWCYLPDLPRSCCPLYTIRLDALEFKPSKSKRKLVNRWNKFCIGKEFPPQDNFTLPTSIRAAEAAVWKGKADHSFEVILEPSSYSEEKFELFCKYQECIHQDDDNTPSSFRRFLVESPLRPIPIPYTKDPPSHLPATYRSYHQLYRVDGVLIAVAVLDILPGCVSSVYFYYDPKWEDYSLGKLSAMREVALAAEIHEAGAPEAPFLYMGFYVHSCVKMRYKGEYSPSYLADPETFEWYPLHATCVPLLEKNRYACFSKPQDSTNEDPAGVPRRDLDVAPELLSEVNAVSKIRGSTLSVVPVNEHPVWDSEGSRNAIAACVAGIGEELAKEIIFYFG
uniref:Arginyl-tRNA--protein transferase 1 n=1 Tax=Mycena chlorophos TaxID=658473 RepID=A0ABQ0LSE3_MYCCL|nr:predicted protein [Mycena chlorophos]